MTGVTRRSRIFINTITTLSLLLCLTTILLWTHSLRVRDALTFVTRSGDAYAVATVPHGVSFHFQESFAELISPLDPHTPGWSCSHERWDSPRTVKLSPSPQLAGVLLHDQYVTLTYQRPPFAYRSLGFAWESRKIPKPTPFPQRIAGYLNYATIAPAQPALQTRTLVLPTWFLVAVFASIPTFRFAATLRRARRRKQNRCLSCGYDLRATPDGCPECGASCATPAAPRRSGRVGKSR